VYSDTPAQHRPAAGEHNGAAAAAADVDFPWSYGCGCGCDVIDWVTHRSDGSKRARREGIDFDDALGQLMMPGTLDDDIRAAHMHITRLRRSLSAES